MMQSIAISSWSLRGHLPRRNFVPTAYGLSIAEFPTLVRDRYGLGAVELCQMHLESPDYSYLEKVKRGLDKANVRVENMPIDVGNISTSDVQKRESDFGTIKRWIKAAAYLGSPAARVNAGTPDSPSWTIAAPVAAYRALVAFGKQMNVRILLENHGGISADPQHIRKIFEGVNSEYFKLCPDFGNWDPVVRYDGLRLMLPHAWIVHVKTYDFDEQGGQPTFNFDECMRAVTESAFRGALSIEFEGEGDQFDGVEQSLALVRGYAQRTAA